MKSNYSILVLAWAALATIIVHNVASECCVSEADAKDDVFCLMYGELSAEQKAQVHEKIGENCDQAPAVDDETLAELASIAEKAMAKKNTEGPNFLRFGKRKPNFLRFGKRNPAEGPNFLRFGKRKPNFLRFGKRKPNFLRFGKRSGVAVAGEGPNFLRFGKRKPNFLRFGKRSPGAEEPNFLRFGKRKPNFLRFGKRSGAEQGPNFLRFGKKSSADDFEREMRKPNFLRFGKRSSEESAAAEISKKESPTS